MSGGRAWLAACWLVLAAPAGAAPAASAVRGEAVYARCVACHAPAYDRVGPRHCALFGRLAGSVPGFHYSVPMKKSGIVWNDKTLDRFLANPTAMVPGTDMTYDGIPGATERSDLIAYLRKLDTTPPCQQMKH